MRTVAGVFSLNPTTPIIDFPNPFKSVIGQRREDKGRLKKVCIEDFLWYFFDCIWPKRLSFCSKSLTLFAFRHESNAIDLLVKDVCSVIVFNSNVAASKHRAAVTQSANTRLGGIKRVAMN